MTKNVLGLKPGEGFQPIWASPKVWTLICNSGKFGQEPWQVLEGLLFTPRKYNAKGKRVK